MDSSKLKVLKVLREGMLPGQKLNKNFISLSKELKMEEQDLDLALNELENERYINQWVIKSSKDFTIEILSKGFEGY